MRISCVRADTAFRELQATGRSSVPGTNSNRAASTGTETHSWRYAESSLKAPLFKVMAPAALAATSRPLTSLSNMDRQWRRLSLQQRLAARIIGCLTDIWLSGYVHIRLLSSTSAGLRFVSHIPITDDHLTQRLACRSTYFCLSLSMSFVTFVLFQLCLQIKTLFL